MVLNLEEVLLLQEVDLMAVITIISNTEASYVLPPPPPLRPYKQQNIFVKDVETIDVICRHFLFRTIAPLLCGRNSVRFGVIGLLSAFHAHDNADDDMHEDDVGLFVSKCDEQCPA